MFIERYKLLNGLSPDYLPVMFERSSNSYDARVIINVFSRLRSRPTISWFVPWLYNLFVLYTGAVKRYRIFRCVWNGIKPIFHLMLWIHELESCFLRTWGFYPMCVWFYMKLSLPVYIGIYCTYCYLYCRWLAPTMSWCFCICKPKWDTVYLSYLICLLYDGSLWCFWCFGFKYLTPKWPF